MLQSSAQFGGFAQRELDNDVLDRRPNKISRLFDKYLKLNETPPNNNDSSDNFVNLLNKIEQSNMNILNDAVKKGEGSIPSNCSKKTIDENTANNISDNSSKQSIDALFKEVLEKIIKSIKAAKIRQHFALWKIACDIDIKVSPEQSMHFLKTLSFYDTIKGLLNAAVHRRLLQWNYVVAEETDHMTVTSKRVLGRALNILERYLVGRKLRSSFLKLRYHI
eukprot:TRINITY_DN12885_c0_g1_i2.p1 TRINITY_DN12885_c0_g1~~TRINITY_DN12885_c0_g1_i2.p1  ORF type:complete len:221 (+),score=59.20 TRINITY_DN12885_c0_g1_i2:288-950(+)